MSKQQRSQETRDRILEAALRSFAQSGYDATGVAEICQAAQVSKGAFYHHFPSKQAVFLDLLHVWLAGLDAQLEDARRTTDTIPQALVHMAGMTRDVFQVADGRLQMFLEFWAQAIREPAFWQATIDPYHRYQALFATLIGEGVSEGSLKPVDPEVAARVIVGLAVGLLLQGLLDPRGADWPEVTRQGIQLLMDGLADA